MRAIHVDAEIGEAEGVHYMEQELLHHGVRDTPETGEWNAEGHEKVDTTLRKTK